MAAKFLVTLPFLVETDTMQDAVTLVASKITQGATLLFQVTDKETSESRILSRNLAEVAIKPPTQEHARLPEPNIPPYAGSKRLH